MSQHVPCPGVDVHFDRWLFVFMLQIENLQEQLRDKEKQMSSLKERVKSLQADTSNTDTALTTLEESLAEKVNLEVSTYLYLCLLVTIYVYAGW